MAKHFESGKEMDVKLFRTAGKMEPYNNEASPFSGGRRISNEC